MAAHKTVTSQWRLQLFREMLYCVFPLAFRSPFHLPPLFLPPVESDCCPRVDKKTVNNLSWTRTPFVQLSACTRTHTHTCSLSDSLAHTNTHIFTFISHFHIMQSTQAERMTVSVTYTHRNPSYTLPPSLPLSHTACV